MPHKIVTDPVTGRSHTEDGVNEEQQRANLERQRRELRDMIGGNTPFHDDPFKTPEAPPETAAVPEPDFTEKDWYRTEGWGYFTEENP